MTATPGPAAVAARARRFIMPESAPPAQGEVRSAPAGIAASSLQPNLIPTPPTRPLPGGPAMQRRQFLKVAPAAGGAPLVVGQFAATAVGAESPDPGAGVPKPAETVRGDMCYRQLGRTGVEVSAIGLGGHH